MAAKLYFYLLLFIFLTGVSKNNYIHLLGSLRVIGGDKGIIRVVIRGCIHEELGVRVFLGVAATQPRSKLTRILFAATTLKL